MKPFRVRVPASSANLGPGFDCLGLALGLYHELHVAAGPAGTAAGIEVELHGEGAGELSTGADNEVVRSLLAALADAGVEPPARLRLASHNDVPLSRGLGSSAVACLAGYAAGQWLATGDVDRQVLLDRGRRREGHADNVAPCIFGGITVVCPDGDGVRVARLPVPAGVIAVLAVPAVELSTRASRSVLPAQVSRADAVQAVAHASLLTAALATGRLDLLGPAMADERLHEPYREALVPGLARVRDAARGAGAWGAALSGAGPSILALAAADRAEAVGTAMADAWRGAAMECTLLHLPVDADGLQVHSLEGEDAG